MSPGPVLLALFLAQAPPVFRADVEVVYVDVYVTRQGAPVTGLADRDFAVKDNGVAQEARVVQREEAPVTAVLVLDCSSSVAGAKLEFLKAAAGSFVRGLHPRDAAALVAIQARVRLLHAATTDREALLDAIGSMTAEGSTSMIDALFVGLKRRWGAGRPVLVLFSDGRDTSSWLENEDLLRAARGSSTTAYVVRTREEGAGGRESGQAYLLRRIVESTGGSSWSWGSGPEIEAAFREVLETVNARYVLAYEPTGVSRSGRHRIDLRLLGADPTAAKRRAVASIALGTRAGASRSPAERRRQTAPDPSSRDFS
jgi:VWFA-related protein